MENNVVALSQANWLEAEADKTITTEELDQIVTRYRDARKVYESAKAKATELQKEQETLKGKVVEALTKVGKRKYFVDGIGLCYFIEKLVVTTPKTLEDKRKFFDWLKATFGDIFLLDKQSINHQSLQKIYNDAYNAEVEQGRGDQFTVPGLSAPTAEISLGFRKE